MGCSSSTAGHGGMNGAKVVMIGPSQSGKTTILYMLKMKELVNTIPTEGANIETIWAARNFNFLVFDCGGGPSSVPSWNKFYPNSDAIVFVIDSANRAQLSDAKDALFTALSDKTLRGVPLMVLANKSDIQGGLSAAEVQEGLHLKAVIDRPWSLQAVCGLHGQGLDVATEDLARLILQARDVRTRMKRDADVLKTVV